MPDETPAKPMHEMVGLFTKRPSFDAAVADLLAAGFARTDLSVLASHDSIDAVDSDGDTVDTTLKAMFSEMRIIEPLTVAGGVMLVGGPVAGAIAAVIAAGIGVIAIKDVLEEVTSTPDHQDFEEALTAGGLILWVRYDDPDQRATAEKVLNAHGALNVHRHETTRFNPD